MLTSDFDYDLPANLIAQNPLPERNSSRMMIVDRQTGEIEHSQFSQLPEYLKKGDILVLNTSRVIPARTWGKKGESEIEFLFLREFGNNLWEVLCRPARKIREKDTIFFSSNLTGRVIKAEPEGQRILQFSRGNVITELNRIGYAPLPPYIKRKKRDVQLRQTDLKRYQTVFAEEGSSVAAPTAGLHFTTEMLEQITENEVVVAPLCLDVGLATFQPVRAKIVEKHRMLEEAYSISRQTAAAINRARKEARPVTAVGTTSVRALESSFKEGKVHHGSSSTDLFIHPGYEFNVVDRVLTNFHLPKSTLLMLVSAFAGPSLIQKAYREAVLCEYRFYSYGDCMLII